MLRSRYCGITYIPGIIIKAVFLAPWRVIDVPYILDEGRNTPKRARSEYHTLLANRSFDKISDLIQLDLG